MVVPASLLPEQRIQEISTALNSAPVAGVAPPIDGDGRLVTRGGELMRDAHGRELTAERFYDGLRLLAEKLNQVDPASLVTSTHNGAFACLEISLHQLPLRQMSLTQILDALERQTILSILNHAETESPAQDALLAHCARLKVAGQASVSALQSHVNERDRQQPAIFAKNKAIVAQSWQASGSDVALAVGAALEHKRVEYGRSRLVMWHDIDQNLTVDEAHNDTSPGLRYAKLAYQRHSRSLLEPIVFGALYDSIYGASVGSHQIGRLAYESVGRRAASFNLLPGVKETFTESRDRHIDSRLLTRNLRWMADGLGQALEIPSHRVFGRVPDNHETTDKPAVILRGILEDPTSVHVVIDDGDESLVRGIESPCLKDGSTIADHAFLITRDNVDNRSYKLGEVMKARSLPHGSQADNYHTALRVLQAALSQA